MLALAARLPAPAGPVGPQGRRSAPKPRTQQLGVGPHRGRTPCRAAAATSAASAEALPAWLASAGVDVGKQAAAVGAGGLVASRDVNPGEPFFAIPKAAWITAETAAASDIGQHLSGCVRVLGQPGLLEPCAAAVARALCSTPAGWPRAGRAAVVCDAWRTHRIAPPPRDVQAGAVAGAGAVPTGRTRQGRRLALGPLPRSAAS